MRERRVIVEARPAQCPCTDVQVLALTLMWLFGGLFVIETVFTYPGRRARFVEAVIDKNIPVIQSVAVLIAAAYIVINIVADLWSCSSFRS